jgi:hypothetical protein
MFSTGSCRFCGVVFSTSRHRRRSSLSAWRKGADVPFGSKLVGEGPSRLLMTLFVAGPFVIAFILLWLTFNAAPTAWLLVRTLSFPLGLAALSALGTWFAARHGDEPAS